MRQIPFRLAILPPRAEAGDASMTPADDNQLERARCRIIGLVKEGHTDKALELYRELAFSIENDGRIFAYEFNEYWKDVGTVDSLWESSDDNMLRLLFSK